MTKTENSRQIKRKIKRSDLVIDNELGRGPIAKKKKKKEASMPPKNVAELNAIFDEVYQLNETLYQIFHMASLTGLRFSDASWLMIEDFIDQETQQFRASFTISQQKTKNMAISRLKNQHIKKYGADALTPEVIRKIESTASQKSKVTIYINDEMKSIVSNILKRRQEKSGLLFPNDHHFSQNLPMSTNGANQILNKVKVKLGLNYPLGTHSFRKFFSNTITKNGCTAERVRDLLGQKSLSSTTLYVSSTEDELKNVVNNISYSL